MNQQQSRSPKNYRRHMNPIPATWKVNRSVRPGKDEGSAALVNLAAASIAGASWSKERKALLAIEPSAHHPRIGLRDRKTRGRPKTIVNASALVYYGIAGRGLTEERKTGGRFPGEIGEHGSGGGKAERWDCV